MKTIKRKICALFPVAGLVLFFAMDAGADLPRYHPSRIIVKTTGSECIDTQVAAALSFSGALRLVKKDGRLGKAMDHEMWVVDLGGGALDPLEAAALVSQQGCVVYAEPDYAGRAAADRLEPDDPLFDDQWYLDNSGDTDVDAPEAWAITTGDPIRVAVLDTGLEMSNPSLLRAYEEGYDFVNEDPDPDDDNGHGSSITSIIACRGNDDDDMAGVSWGAKILAVKVLDASSWGYYSWWISGLEWAVEHDAKVINMSLGGTDRSDGLEEAVNAAVDAGAVVVAAMMNDGTGAIKYPAAYEAVIAVGATDRDGKRVTLETGGTWGSNYGPHIDISAPGLEIMSADIDETFNYWSGTSMSTAVVSGAAALLLTVAPELAPAEVGAVIKATARDGEGDPGEDTPGWDVYHGGGRLDMDNMLLQSGNDLDGDGWTRPDDCDDTDPDVNPDAEEIPFNDIDDDCNPLTSDNCCIEETDEPDVADIADASEADDDISGEMVEKGCGCTISR